MDVLPFNCIGRKSFFLAGNKDCTYVAKIPNANEKDWFNCTFIFGLRDIFVKQTYFLQDWTRIIYMHIIYPYFFVNVWSYLFILNKH